MQNCTPQQRLPSHPKQPLGLLQQQPGIDSLSTTTGVVDESLRCDLCGVTASSEADLDMHRQGKNHKRRAREAELGHSGFSCVICSVLASSQELLDAHMHGKKHLKKLQELEAQRATPTCALCGLSFVDWAAKKQHELSPEHVARITEQQQQHRCEVCLVYATSAQGLREHCEGKEHHRKLTALNQAMADASASSPAKPPTAARGLDMAHSLGIRATTTTALPKLAVHVQVEPDQKQQETAVDDDSMPSKQAPAFCVDWKLVHGTGESSYGPKLDESLCDSPQDLADCVVETPHNGEPSLHTCVCAHTTRPCRGWPRFSVCVLT